MIVPGHVRGRLAVGLGLSGLIGLLGYRRQALSAGGAAGAVVVGTPIYAAGGLRGSLLLLIFFVSSSALSRLGQRRKADVVAEFSKGARRDLGQALANGGVAAGCAALALAWPEWPLDIAMAAALAEANADTWATELGTLSSKPPRLITSGRIVPAGTSGGVTPTGLAAAACGAFAIALPAALLADDRRNDGVGRVERTVAVTLAGVAGSLSDSVLGATWQAMYWCPHCDRWTERQIHHCGTPTELRRGLPWLDNDAVNAIATLVAAILAILLPLLRHPISRAGRTIQQT